MDRHTLSLREMLHAHVMHFQSQTPGILISDIKNCINVHTSCCSKGILCRPLFSILHENPSKQMHCYNAVDERPGHCRLQRAGSDSRCLISMFSPPSAFSTFSSSAQDVRDIANIKRATTNTRSAFVVHSLPPATSIKAQEIL